MENECEALPGVAYPGVRDNRSTLNTETGYDEYDVPKALVIWFRHHICFFVMPDAASHCVIPIHVICCVHCW